MSSVHIANPQPPALALPHVARISLRWPHDRWLTATGLTAIITSLLAFWYSYQHHLILLYNDAYSHLIIARRVVDNAAPGLSQLGGVWLPLPHFIMMPFIWSDALLRSGLAGSFSSMPCYVVAAIFIFLSVRRLTHDSRASYLGALVFILNPNMLYLQTTPLSEPVLLATMTSSCYFFLAWVQSDELKHLIWCGVATFLATLARYDGWMIYLGILFAIACICWQRRTPWRKMEDYLLLYGVLGGLGIGLWFLWGAMIFHDPLYFQHGPYSAQQQQLLILKHGSLETYHNVGQDLHFYFFTVAEIAGPAVLIVSILGLVTLLFRKRLNPEFFALLPFVVPIGFYILSLYSGQAVLYVPGASALNPTQLFNARYGTEALPAIALGVGYLAQRWPLGQFFLTGVVVFQTIFTATGGIVTLQDGQFGSSCALARQTSIFLAQHYDGTPLLEDTYFRNSEDPPFYAPILLKNIIYQGSGAVWYTALYHPATTVTWIMTRPGDIVTAHIAINDPTFLSTFTLVAQDSDGELLFHRANVPMVTQQVAPELRSEHSRCGSVTQPGTNPTNPTPVKPDEHLTGPTQ